MDPTGTKVGQEAEAARVAGMPDPNTSIIVEEAGGFMPLRWQEVILKIMPEGDVQRCFRAENLAFAAKTDSLRAAIRRLAIGEIAAVFADVTDKGATMIVRA